MSDAVNEICETHNTYLQPACLSRREVVSLLCHFPRSLSHRIWPVFA